MKLTTCLVALSICAFSSFAQEPQTPAAVPATAAAPATPAPAADAKPDAAATVAATEPKADKSQIVDKAATDAEIKTMRARGYKPVNRNGILVYCRPEGLLGTHFQHDHCSTMDQLKQAERTGSEYVKSLQQQGSPTEFKGDMPGSATH
jgi:hypothetical protein